MTDEKLIIDGRYHVDKILNVEFREYDMKRGGNLSLNNYIEWLEKRVKNELPKEEDNGFIGLAQGK